MGFDLETAKPVEGFDLSTAKPAAKKEPKTWGGIALESAGNLPKSVYGLVSGIGSALAHPINTTGSILDLAAGEVNKVLPESVVSTLKSIDPNPDAYGRSEKVANIVNNQYKQNYGSVEGFKEHLANDPAAVLGDLSTVLSGGAGLVGKVGEVGNISKASQLADALSTASKYTNPLTYVVGGAGKALGAAKGLVQPFSDSGRLGIVGDFIKSQIEPYKVPDFLQELSTNTGKTEGFMPSVGQATTNPKMQSIERSVKSVHPEMFQDQAQRNALAGALADIAKNPEERAIAQAAVDAKAKDLYTLANAEHMPVTPELTNLARRPSMISSAERAKNLAKEIGMNPPVNIEDLLPKYLTVNSPDKVSRVQGKFNPYNNVAPAEEAIVTKGAPSTFEVPPVESVPVSGMHTIKMGMDALLSDPTLGIAKTESNAIKATRGQLLDLMPEAYQKARLAHVENMKPVNQIDIGQELYSKLVPALSDAGGNAPFKLSADAYARALQNGDQLAQNVTGLKNSKLENIMTPEQMAKLQGVAEDARMIAKGITGGKPSGSDTWQHFAMQGLMNKAGIPNFISESGLGGAVKSAGNYLYKNADEATKAKLAEVLANPAMASKAVQKSLDADARMKKALELSNLIRAGIQPTLNLQDFTN
jgi:hypothetical protein